MSRIGYVGLGSLGSAILPNIAAYAKDNNLPAPSVWNRSQAEKYAQLATDLPEVYAAKELADVVERSDVIFTCLVNDAAVEQVYAKLVAALKANPRQIVFADQTTVQAGTANKIKDLVESAGGIYITNTVFGQPAAARARQLVIVSAGAAQGREIIKPIITAIGRKIIDVGDDNAKGAALKLLGNAVILGAIQLYSEVYALSDAIGFDPQVFHELHQSLFASPVLLNYSNKISQGKFGDAGFTLSTGLKDANHILSLGEEFGHPTKVPTVERAKESLIHAQELGADGLDWSSLSIVARQQAGLDLWRQGTNNGKDNAST